MEPIINNASTYERLIIWSQDAQFCPVVTRKDSDIELTIVGVDCPVKLVIDAYVA